jgi:hypothetical protein
MRLKYLLPALFILVLEAHGATEITQYGITWKFDQEYTSGQFCNGDYWVVGPVKIISITNSWHKHGVSAEPGLDGSMINPPATDKQGYDKRLNSYVASLNVAEKKPLDLKPGESLVSSVSWLAGEPGCPKINGGTKMPRPVLRDAAVLTCLDSVSPEGSFRPPYCGNDKTIRFNKSTLRYDLLPSLSSVSGTPDLSKIEKAIERPWIDHVYQYLGAMVHPSENMPQYGREFSIVLGDAALMLLLDFPAEKKQKLLISFVQIGIDFGAIADNGGGWPSNGGHHMGRKWPILFAGLMLNDEHMKNAGQWKTPFQEDLDTFYVSQTEVDITHGGSWAPDKRAPSRAYEKENIGLPEWGIRHAKDPAADNLDWTATYRPINNVGYTGWVLAAQIMGQKQAWNHDPLFDYADRIAAVDPGSFSTSFVANMWKSYRANCGPQWIPNDRSNFYSPGKIESK